MGSTQITVKYSMWQYTNRYTSIYHTNTHECTAVHTAHAYIFIRFRSHKFLSSSTRALGGHVLFTSMVFQYNTQYAFFKNYSKTFFVGIAIFKLAVNRQRTAVSTLIHIACAHYVLARTAPFFLFILL